MLQIGIPADEDFGKNYYAAIRAMDALPVPILTLEDVEKLQQCDGLLIPGGVDVNPALYHQENTASVGINDELDTLEMKVMEKAVELKLPVLGICRGEQLINVYFGGTLIQHIDHADRHARKIEDPDKVHMSKAVEGSFIEGIYHKTDLSINSAHHQAVDQLADGFTAAQYSDDGYIEAYQHNTLPVYAVQWHPERMCLANAREETEDGFQIFAFFKEVIENHKL